MSSFFQFTDQLCRHYSQDKAHTDRMKRYGVEKLLVDERTRVKAKRRRTPSPDKVIYIHRREYIIIDEWSEELEKAKQEEKNSVEDEVILPLYWDVGITLRESHDKTATCSVSSQSFLKISFISLNWMIGGRTELYRDGRNTGP